MGIQNFYSWIKSTYPQAFKNDWLDGYDNIHIDLNYLLHMCSYNCRSQNDIISRLDSLIETIVNIGCPSISVNLYADGPSPLAKLLLQRKRRLTMSRADKDLNISALNFTPGTRFMTNLERKLSYTIEKIIKLNNVTVNCYIDSVDEAELKIKRKIMDTQSTQPHQTHLIVTSDADVVVMMSTLKDISNVFILFKDKGFTTLNIFKLLSLHTDKFGMSKNFGMDFAFVNMLLGNDYIPKIQFNTFDKIWNAYRSCVQYYPDGICDEKLNINKNFMCDLLLGLVGKTHPNLIKKCKLRDINDKLYPMYIDGLMWCMGVYTNGECDRYNYMYEYQMSPHPFILYMMLSKDDSPIVIKKIKSEPITKSLYGILLLPKSAKELIDKKYHKFIDENYKLYDEECCKHCVKFHEELSCLNRDLHDLNEDDDKNDKIIRSKIANASREMVKHKKTHAGLVLDDIETIIKKFNEVF